jgi:NIPSNAP
MDKVYLHATLKIKIGSYDRFCKSMAEQIPVLESLGWKLVGAWTMVVGRVSTIVDVWEIPDANSFFEATGKWRQTAAFTAFRAVTSEVVEEEILTMCKKVSYSP